MKKKTMVLTIRGTKEDKINIEKGIKIYNTDRCYDEIYTKSRFLLRVAKDYPILIKNSEDLSKKCDELESEIIRLRSFLVKFKQIISFVQDLN